MQIKTAVKGKRTRKFYEANGMAKWAYNGAVSMGKKRDTEYKRGDKEGQIWHPILHTCTDAGTFQLRMPFGRIGPARAIGAQVGPLNEVRRSSSCMRSLVGTAH